MFVRPGDAYSGGEVTGRRPDGTASVPPAELAVGPGHFAPVLIAYKADLRLMSRSVTRGLPSRLHTPF
jgi:hypothetical protein